MLKLTVIYNDLITRGSNNISICKYTHITLNEGYDDLESSLLRSGIDLPQVWFIFVGHLDCIDFSNDKIEQLQQIFL
jgi:hypothetical protein